MGRSPRKRSSASSVTSKTLRRSGGRSYQAHREWLIDRHGSICAYCGVETDPDEMTLDHVRPRKGQSAYDRPDNLVRLSTPVAARNLELKRFLNQRLYRHPRMEATRDRYRRVIEGLFHAYRAEPEHLPPAHSRRGAGEAGLERAICDYIAGMTDRFALDEYQRLHGRDPLTGKPIGST